MTLHFAGPYKDGGGISRQLIVAFADQALHIEINTYKDSRLAPYLRRGKITKEFIMACIAECTLCRNDTSEERQTFLRILEEWDEREPV